MADVQKVLIVIGIIILAFVGVLLSVGLSIGIIYANKSNNANISIPCPTGYTGMNGNCIDLSPTGITCPTGWTQGGAGCIPPIVCPDGWKVVNGTCIPENVSCPTGYALQNGVCRPDSNGIKIPCSTNKLYPSTLNDQLVAEVNQNKVPVSHVPPHFAPPDMLHQVISDNIVVPSLRTIYSNQDVGRGYEYSSGHSVPANSNSSNSNSSNSYSNSSNSYSKSSSKDSSNSYSNSHSKDSSNSYSNSYSKDSYSNTPVSYHENYRSNVEYEQGSLRLNSPVYEYEHTEIKKKLGYLIPTQQLPLACDAVGYSKYVLSIQGDDVIITCDGKYRKVKNSNIVQLVVFKRKIFGRNAEGQILKLDMETFNTNLWRWKESKMHGCYKNIGVTLDGKCMYMQEKNNVYVLDNDYNSIYRQTSEGIRRYGLTHKQYIDIKNGKIYSSITKNKYDGHDGALDCNGQLWISGKKHQRVAIVNGEAVLCG